MLKRTIKYTDFNDNEVSEVFYFNISKSELVELEVSYQQGFQEHLQSVIEADDKKELIAEFKKLILMAYGIKSEDGKRFVKSEELNLEFSQTAAYNALFMELAIDDNAAAAFIMGIVPKDMQGEVSTEMNKQMAAAPTPQVDAPTPQVDAPTPQVDGLAPQTVVPDAVMPPPPPGHYQPAQTE